MGRDTRNTSAQKRRVAPKEGTMQDAKAQEVLPRHPHRFEHFDRAGEVGARTLLLWSLLRVALPFLQPFFEAPEPLT